MDDSMVKDGKGSGEELKAQLPIVDEKKELKKEDVSNSGDGSMSPAKTQADMKEGSAKSESMSSPTPPPHPASLLLNSNSKTDVAEQAPKQGILPSMGILPGNGSYDEEDSHFPDAPERSNGSLKETMPSHSSECQASSPTPEGSSLSNADKCKQLKESISPPGTSKKEDAKVPSAPDSCPTSCQAVEAGNISHKVKRIKWKDIEVPIITQNNNGPCPLLAILNAMVLKGTVTLPRDRQEITGAELVSIVGNAVFDVPRSSVPSEMHQYLEQNTQDAVDILHKLLTGLDVNVKFSGVRDFEFTPELSVFDVLGVALYHGWVVDPSSEAAPLVTEMSYNQLTNNIIMWLEDTTAKNDDLFLKAMLCEEFINGSVSQLTIHGLFELGSTLEDEEIAVFFRNNHFSTIYKRKGQLYQLLTDQGFLHEDAVWQTLTDVDATFSEFVTGNFRSLETPSSETPDPANMTKEQQINSDHQLATMLQQEAEKIQQREDDFSKVVTDLGLQNLPDEEIARRLQERENQIAAEDSRNQEEQQPSGNGEGSANGLPSPSHQQQQQSHAKDRRRSQAKNSNQCDIL